MPPPLPRAARSALAHCLLAGCLLLALATPAAAAFGGPIVESSSAPGGRQFGVTTDVDGKPALEAGDVQAPDPASVIAGAANANVPAPSAPRPVLEPPPGVSGPPGNGKKQEGLWMPHELEFEPSAGGGKKIPPVQGIHPPAKKTYAPPEVKEATPAPKEEAPAAKKAPETVVKNDTPPSVEDTPPAKKEPSAPETQAPPAKKESGPAPKVKSPEMTKEEAAPTKKEPSAPKEETPFTKKDSAPLPKDPAPAPKDAPSTKKEATPSKENKQSSPIPDPAPAPKEVPSAKKEATPSKKNEQSSPSPDPAPISKDAPSTKKEATPSKKKEQSSDIKITPPLKEEIPFATPEPAPVVKEEAPPAKKQTGPKKTQAPLAEPEATPVAKEEVAPPAKKVDKKKTSQSSHSATPKDEGPVPKSKPKKSKFPAAEPIPSQPPPVAKHDSFSEHKSKADVELIAANKIRPTWVPPHNYVIPDGFKCVNFGPVQQPGMLQYSLSDVVGRTNTYSVKHALFQKLPTAFLSHVFGEQFQYNLRTDVWRKDARFDIILGFAEVYSDVCSHSPTKRVFTVEVDGRKKWVNARKRVGCGNELKIEMKNVKANNGKINLKFSSVQEKAFVSVVCFSGVAPSGGPVKNSHVGNKPITQVTSTPSVGKPSKTAGKNKIGAVPSKTDVELKVSEETPIPSTPVVVVPEPSKKEEVAVDYKPTKKQDVTVDTKPTKKQDVTVDTKPAKEQDVTVDTKPTKKQDVTVDTKPTKTQDATVDAKPTKKEEMVAQNSIDMLSEMKAVTCVRFGKFTVKGFKKYKKSAYTGRTQTFVSEGTVKGTSLSDAFRSHVYGHAFMYQVDVPKSGTYSMALGFAETNEPACISSDPNFRLFSVSVGDESRELSIFSAAGCNTAHVEMFENVQSEQDNVISIGFESLASTAMISNLCFWPSKATVSDGGKGKKKVEIGAVLKEDAPKKKTASVPSASASPSASAVMPSATAVASVSNSKDGKKKTPVTKEDAEPSVSPTPKASEAKKTVAAPEPSASPSKSPEAKKEKEVKPSSSPSPKASKPKKAAAASPFPKSTQGVIEDSQQFEHHGSGSFYAGTLSGSNFPSPIPAPPRGTPLPKYTKGVIEDTQGHHPSNSNILIKNNNTFVHHGDAGKSKQGVVGGGSSDVAVSIPGADSNTPPSGDVFGDPDVEAPVLGNPDAPSPGKTGKASPTPAKAGIILPTAAGSSKPIPSATEEIGKPSPVPIKLPSASLGSFPTLGKASSSKTPEPMPSSTPKKKESTKKGSKKKDSGKKAKASATASPIASPSESDAQPSAPPLLDAAPEGIVLPKLKGPSVTPAAAPSVIKLPTAIPQPAAPVVTAIPQPGVETESGAEAPLPTLTEPVVVTMPANPQPDTVALSPANITAIAQPGDADAGALITAIPQVGSASGSEAAPGPSIIALPQPSASSSVAGTPIVTALPQPGVGDTDSSGAADTVITAVPQPGVGDAASSAGTDPVVTALPQPGDADASTGSPSGVAILPQPAPGENAAETGGAVITAIPQPGAGAGDSTTSSTGSAGITAIPQPDGSSAGGDITAIPQPRAVFPLRGEPINGTSDGPVVLQDQNQVEAFPTLGNTSTVSGATPPSPVALPSAIVITTGNNTVNGSVIALPSQTSLPSASASSSMSVSPSASSSMSISPSASASVSVSPSLSTSPSPSASPSYVPRSLTGGTQIILLDNSSLTANGSEPSPLPSRDPPILISQTSPVPVATGTGTTTSASNPTVAPTPLLSGPYAAAVGTRREVGGGFAIGMGIVGALLILMLVSCLYFAIFAGRGGTRSSDFSSREEDYDQTGGGGYMDDGYPVPTGYEDDTTVTGRGGVDADTGNDGGSGLGMHSSYGSGESGPQAGLEQPPIDMNDDQYDTILAEDERDVGEMYDTLGGATQDGEYHTGGHDDDGYYGPAAAAAVAGAVAGARGSDDSSQAYEGHHGHDAALNEQRASGSTVNPDDTYDAAGHSFDSADQPYDDANQEYDAARYSGDSLGDDEPPSQDPRDLVSGYGSNMQGQVGDTQDIPREHISRMRSQMANIHLAIAKQIADSASVGDSSRGSGGTQNDFVPDAGSSGGHESMSTGTDTDELCYKNTCEPPGVGVGDVETGPSSNGPWPEWYKAPGADARHSTQAPAQAEGGTGLLQSVREKLVATQADVDMDVSASEGESDGSWIGRSKVPDAPPPPPPRAGGGAVGALAQRWNRAVDETASATESGAFSDRTSDSQPPKEKVGLREISSNMYNREDLAPASSTGKRVAFWEGGGVPSVSLGAVGSVPFQAADLEKNRFSARYGTQRASGAPVLNVDMEELRKRREPNVKEAAKRLSVARRPGSQESGSVC